MYYNQRPPFVKLKKWLQNAALRPLKKKKKQPAPRNLNSFVCLSPGKYVREVALL